MAYSVGLRCMSGTHNTERSLAKKESLQFAKTGNVQLLARISPTERPHALLAFSGRTSELNASMEEAQAPKAPSTSDANAPSDEFLELKKKLLSRAKKGAGSVAVYIFLQQGITAMACSLLGSFAGYAYLKSLIGTVEGYSADSEVPIVNAREIYSQPLRALAIIAAIYRQALKPRLLIPISIAAGVSAFNATQPQAFSIMQEFDILLGFLFSYKAGLILALYDDIKPKANLDGDSRPERPTLAGLADLDDERKQRLLEERIRR